MVHRALRGLQAQLDPKENQELPVPSWSAPRDSLEFLEVQDWKENQANREYQIFSREMSALQEIKV